MTIVKTTRLKKDGNAYEIEIPEEFVQKLEWRNGHILEVTEQEDKLVIETDKGFEKIEIYDIEGNIIAILNFSEMINIQHLKNGYYFISLIAFSIF